MRKHKNNPATTILLCGEIGEAMVGAFMEDFGELDVRKQPGGITVRLTSHGGCATAGFAIHDIIRLAKNHVTTEVWGMAESIAALVFEAGHTRLMAPSARLLLHDVQADSSSTTGSRGVQAIADDVKELEKLYFNIVGNRAGIGPDAVKKWCARTTIFSSAQAVEAKLADDILQE